MSYLVRKKGMADGLRPLTKALLLVSSMLILVVQAEQSDVIAGSTNNNEASLIEIVNPYMPEVSPVSNVAAVYLRIENHSTKVIHLSQVTSPAAHHIMMHQTIEVDGVAKMKHIMSLDIEAGRSLEFKPGGLHIMMMGLVRDKISQSFPLSLLIDDKEFLITVKVEKR